MTMEQRKEFESPNIEIIQLSQEDTIMTSGIELPDHDWL